MKHLNIDYLSNRKSQESENLFSTGEVKTCQVDSCPSNCKCKVNHIGLQNIFANYPCIINKHVAVVYFVPWTEIYLFIGDKK
jgi:hypothetical protein